MKQIIIKLDNDYTDNAMHIAEYLGISRHAVYQAVKAKKQIKGHDYEIVGVYNKVAAYSMIDENNNVVFKGTREEIANKYFYASGSIVISRIINGCKIVRTGWKLVDYGQI